MSLMAGSRRTVAQTAARPALLRRGQHGLVGEPMPAFARFCPQMPASERFLAAGLPASEPADLAGFVVVLRRIVKILYFWVGAQRCGVAGSPECDRSESSICGAPLVEPPLLGARDVGGGSVSLGSRASLSPGLIPGPSLRGSRSRSWPGCELVAPAQYALPNAGETAAIVSSPPVYGPVARLAAVPRGKWLKGWGK